ncbi:MAG: hypothetical protein ABF876_05495 [Acetobacter aceti]
MTIPPKPKLPSASIQEESVNEFIGAAPGKEQYPWENPAVRRDMLLQLNTKIPEVLMLKLEYLLAQDAYTRLRTEPRLSKQSVVLEAIEQHVNERLKRSGVPKDRI